MGAQGESQPTAAATVRLTFICNHCQSVMNVIGLIRPNRPPE
jgi:hypothetical protein